MFPYQGKMALCLLSWAVDTYLTLSVFSIAFELARVGSGGVRLLDKVSCIFSKSHACFASKGSQ